LETQVANPGKLATQKKLRTSCELVGNKLETSWKPGLATSFQLVRLVGCDLKLVATHRINVSEIFWLLLLRRLETIIMCMLTLMVDWQVGYT